MYLNEAESPNTEVTQVPCRFKLEKLPTAVCNFSSEVKGFIYALAEDQKLKVAPG